MNLKITLIGLIFVGQAAIAECDLVAQRGAQKHYRCHFPHTSKTLQVLELSGTYAETAYYHGYFLKNQIESGVIKGVASKAANALASLPQDDQQIARSIQQCILDRYKANVSDEFKKGITTMTQGLHAAGSKLSPRTVEDANYMVEFSIFVDALSKKELHKTLAAIGCGGYLLFPENDRAFTQYSEQLSKIKMGCTGIVANSQSTQDRQLIHGRNFDTGLLGYYENNQVVLIHHLPNGRTVTTLSSAGIHYGGGISGFNSDGISVSLHELQTTNVRTNYFWHYSDIAPFLSHRLLMETDSIDSAIELIKETKGFGAWTFLITDAKTNEVASVEMSGDIVRVARRYKNQSMGQSNHFLHPDTAEYGFQYSPNKTLESQARLEFVTRRLKEDSGQINSGWLIDHLSAHHDEKLNTLRSFGKTTTKVYTSASHVMIPGSQEFWMSLGDLYPTNRNPFIGFAIDPAASQKGLFPLKFLGTQTASEEPGRAHWYDSMGNFVNAFLIYEHQPRNITSFQAILSQLETAIEKSQQDGIYEFPYHFMKARILIAMAQNQNRIPSLRNEARRTILSAQEKLVEVKNLYLSGQLLLGKNEIKQIEDLLLKMKANDLPQNEIHFATVE